MSADVGSTDANPTRGVRLSGVGRYFEVTSTSNEISPTREGRGSGSMRFSPADSSSARHVLWPAAYGAKAGNNRYLFVLDSASLTHVSHWRTMVARDIH